ncbi:MAG TPA: type IV toxin-antitoxin system AbiEi family antitoxin domain-containing protein, partial [Pyrinomonadaceae bacterium]|nr:type IV toxin-antitoxin system AbiEi family antitoxin domain-containing protein [Pyrinomonadaceae bacterium]
MTPKERVLEFAQEKKVFRASEAEKATSASRVYLERLVSEGKLKKAGYGLYSLAENKFSEMQDIL